MTNKVLVADDFDGISLFVEQILKERSVCETTDAKYCDEAYLKIKKAIYDKAPYKLLISDLNFKRDHRNSRFKSGEELISAIKKLQPDIKIIVFSEEVKSFRIKSLFRDYKINAFVHKGSYSSSELEKALQDIFSEDKPTPSSEIDPLRNQSLIDIEEYDIRLLKLQSNGYSLNEISICLKKMGVSPNSKSSIEKSINKLRIQFNAKNTVHLIAIAKDLGLI
jgi:DNA-binding NarL/FixJ family response regulator